MQYPEGALCLEQIKQLLIATHERRVVVYAFNYDAKSNKARIVPVEFFTYSAMDSTGSVLDVRWLQDREPVVNFIATDARCLPYGLNRDKDRGWVFGNYWLAYAYGLRLANDKSC